MEEKPNNSFNDRVYDLVSQIPEGKVMTYGQIAAMCGSPRAARIVGGIAHRAPCTNQPACKRSLQPADLSALRHDFDCDCSAHCTSCTAHCAARQESCRCTNCKARGSLCPMHDLIWARVVKKDGSLAEGYPGGVTGHQAALKQEGVTFLGGKAIISKHLWKPNLY